MALEDSQQPAAVSDSSGWVDRALMAAVVVGLLLSVAWTVLILRTVHRLVVSVSETYIGISLAVVVVGVFAAVLASRSRRGTGDVTQPLTAVTGGRGGAVLRQTQTANAA